MPNFSLSSKQKLDTCHMVLKTLMYKVIEKTDIIILCGHRNEKEQNAAFSAGNSKLKWPKSKHNSEPSMAVDIAPWPIDWKNISRFKSTAIIIKDVWNSMSDLEKDGYHLMWGGDWTSFKDYPHWELQK